MKYKLRSLENNMDNMEESGDTYEKGECTYVMVIGEDEVNVEDDGSGKDEKITKPDLLEHLKQLNELIASQNEQFKEEISNLRNTFEPLLSLHHIFQDLHNFTHEAVIRNSGNILINSEEIADLKTPRKYQICYCSYA